MARKQIPLVLLKAKGTVRSYHNQDEPKPDAPETLLTPPSWLAKDAKREWRLEAKEAIRIGVLTNSDRSTFADLCILQARVKDAYRMSNKMDKEQTEKAKKSGKVFDWTMVNPTPNGFLVQNPYIGIYNRALAELNKMRSEFGLTPSSRSKIKVNKPDRKNPFAEFGT